MEAMKKEMLFPPLPLTSLARWIVRLIDALMRLMMSRLPSFLTLVFPLAKKKAE